MIELLLPQVQASNWSIAATAEAEAVWYSNSTGGCKKGSQDGQARTLQTKFPYQTEECVNDVMYRFDGAI